MNTENIFQGVAHSTRSDMLETIAYEFMTAGGANSPELIDTMERDDEALVAECLQGWDLGDVTADELRPYIAAFWDRRPDREA